MGGSFRPKRPTPPPPPPKPTPTKAEVSQSDPSPTGYDARKTKARGRASTILSGPVGVEQEVTLGRKTLLGY